MPGKGVDNLGSIGNGQRIRDVDTREHGCEWMPEVWVHVSTCGYIYICMYVCMYVRGVGVHEHVCV